MSKELGAEVLNLDISIDNPYPIGEEVILNSQTYAYTIVTNSVCIVLQLDIQDFYDVASEVGINAIIASRDAAVQKSDHFFSLH